MLACGVAWQYVSFALPFPAELKAKDRNENATTYPPSDFPTGGLRRPAADFSRQRISSGRINAPDGTDTMKVTNHLCSPC